MPKRKTKDPSITPEEQQEAQLLYQLKREELRKLADTEPDDTFEHFLKLTRISMEAELMAAQAIPEESTARIRLATELGKLGLQLAKSKGKGQYAKLLEELKDRRSKGSKLIALAGGDKASK